MMVQARIGRAVSSRPARKLCCGFTLIELMVTVAVLAILLAIAMPNFSSQIQSGRTQMALQGFKQAVTKAHNIATNSSRRTALTINGSASGVAGCDDAMWVITQGSQIVECMTKTDFSKRYEKTSVNSAAKTVLTFLSSGLTEGIVDDSGNSLSSVSYEMTSGKTTKTIRINASGVVDVL